MVFPQMRCLDAQIHRHSAKEAAEAREVEPPCAARDWSSIQIIHHLVRMMHPGPEVQAS